MKIKISVNAPVTLGFVGICFFIMLLDMVADDFVSKVFITYHSSLTNPLTYLQLFIHVLGHVDWSHFLQTTPVQQCHQRQSQLVHPSFDNH